MKRVQDVPYRLLPTRSSCSITNEALTEALPIARERLAEPWPISLHGWPYWAVGTVTIRGPFRDGIDSHLWTARREWVIPAWRGRSRERLPLPDPLPEVPT